MADHLFRTPSRNAAYESVADDLGDIYQDAVSLRNTFVDTTRDSEIRRDGKALARSIDSTVTDAKSLLEAIADETDDVDTEFMVRQGWELSVHDPADLPDDLVFACRVVDSIAAAQGEIQWLVDDICPPSADEPTAFVQAADRIVDRFPRIADQFAKINTAIPGVTPTDDT